MHHAQTRRDISPVTPPMGTLLLLPVGLGDAAWSIWLPQHVRDSACAIEHFVVENAKSARAELARLGHPKPLRELAINELPASPTLADCDQLLAPALAGHNIALMSDAGCPAVADPGALLVRRSHELGICVRPLVGPSSLMLALMASGLDGQRFAFHGYLPARDPERAKKIVSLDTESARLTQTQLFIETPYRNQALFAALLQHSQTQTRLCVATDLTLNSELVITRKISGWRTVAMPDLDKRPTVFLLLATIKS